MFSKDKDFLDMAALIVGILFIVLGVADNSAFLLLMGVGIAAMFFTPPSKDRVISMSLIMVLMLAHVLTPSIIKTAIGKISGNVYSSFDSIGHHVKDVVSVAKVSSGTLVKAAKVSATCDTSGNVNFTKIEGLLADSVDGFNIHELPKYAGSIEVDGVDKATFSALQNAKGLTDDATSWCLKTIVGLSQQGCGITQKIVDNCII